MYVVFVHIVKKGKSMAGETRQKILDVVEKLIPLKGLARVTTRGFKDAAQHVVRNEHPNTRFYPYLTTIVWTEIIVGLVSIVVAPRRPGREVG